MPLYNCEFEDGTLGPDQKKALAQEITDIHCKVTGAPASFVHVLFSSHRREDSFTGGKPAGFTAVQANIRDGRSDMDKQKLLKEITKACVRIGGVAAEQLVVAVNDIPAKYIMEGAMIMPEPGQEEAWLAQHRAS